MPRPGRNDPCPCGSGKKYKRCCLGKEQGREEFKRVLAADAMPLLRELGRYAAARVGAPVETIARERFPFWRPPLDAIRGARLLDYLIFDERPEKYGHSAAEEFAAERAPLYSAAWQNLLHIWPDATTRLYQLESWADGFAICREVLSEQSRTLEVLPLEQGQQISVGSPVGLRALPVASRYTYPSWPITFGDRNVDEVADALRNRHHAFVRSQRIVSLDEFLRLSPTAIDEEAATMPTSSRIIVPGR